METPAAFVGRSPTYIRMLTLLAVAPVAALYVPFVLARASLRLGYILVFGKVPRF